MAEPSQHYSQIYDDSSGYDLLPQSRNHYYPPYPYAPLPPPLAYHHHPQHPSPQQQYSNDDPSASEYEQSWPDDGVEGESEGREVTRVEQQQYYPHPDYYTTSHEREEPIPTSSAYHHQQVPYPHSSTAESFPDSSTDPLSAPYSSTLPAPSPLQPPPHFYRSPPIFQGWAYGNPPIPSHHEHRRQLSSSYYPSPSVTSPSVYYRQSDQRNASMPELYPHVPASAYQPQRASTGDMEAHMRGRMDSEMSQDGGGAITGLGLGPDSSRAGSAAEESRFEELRSLEEEEDESKPRLDIGGERGQRIGMRVGRGEPPRDAANRRYKCEECHQKFARPSALATHILSHTKEKPFQCLTCNRQFAVMSNLRRHCRVRNHELAVADKPTRGARHMKPKTVDPGLTPIRPQGDSPNSTTSTPRDFAPPPWTAMFHGIPPGHSNYIS